MKISTSELSMSSGPQPAVVAMSETRFSVLSYPERIDEVLELRRTAQCAAKQIAAHTLADDLFDRRDLRASIGVAEIGGRIVGTMRLTPPLEGRFLHEDNRCIGPIVGLPSAAEYLELSKACVHPDYQGQGILWQLTAHMLVLANKLAKPYLIAGANASMWHFWKRCGFRKTGTSYVGPHIPGVKYALMVLDLEEVMANRGVSPKLTEALSPLLAEGW